MLDLFSGFAADPAIRVVPSAGPSFQSLGPGTVYVGQPDWYETADQAIKAGQPVTMVLGSNDPNRPSTTLMAETAPPKPARVPGQATQNVVGLLNTAIQTAGQIYQAQASARSERSSAGSVPAVPRVPRVNGGNKKQKQEAVVASAASVMAPIVSAGEKGMAYFGDTKAEQHQNLMRTALIVTVVLVGGIIVIRMVNGRQVVYAR